MNGMNDFRNPPGQYDPHAHKQRHEEQQRMGPSTFKEIIWNAASLLIAFGILVLIFYLIFFS